MNDGVEIAAASEDEGVRDGKDGDGSEAGVVLSAARQNAIRTRRIRFSYPEGSLDRHYVQGDLVLSHAIAVLSGMFPEGEDYFVRTVRHFYDQIDDPQLRRDAGGFIGQEVTHGREHRVLNERLDQMGYFAGPIERLMKNNLGTVFDRVPKILSMAITAAVEHFTAIFAEITLTDPRAQDLLGESEVRSILLWHALEEAEHKAVAFDVYQAVGGTERMRVNTMRFVRIAFAAYVVSLTALSLATDRAAYNPRRLWRSLRDLRRSPFLTRHAREYLAAYLKPGFHPNDVDTTELIENWRAELFGNNGSLTANLL